MADYEDLKETKVPLYLRTPISLLLPEVSEGFKDMPSALPNHIRGCTVAIVGCGTGRDAFLSAALVGATGRVVALDQSHDAILEAQQHKATQLATFGLEDAVLTFEHWEGNELPFADSSVDVVVINPLFNAVTDKPFYLREAFRVLKEGGELYLSTVFCNRRLSDEARSHLSAYSGYVAESLYVEDFRRMLIPLDLHNLRYVEKRAIRIPRNVWKGLPISKKTRKSVVFTFRTLRVFKLHNLEDLCENYGQRLTYLGTASGCEQFFDLDDQHRFFTDEPIDVCGNTCALIEDTRFNPFFKIEGNRSEHYGIYDYCWYCGNGKKEDDIKKPKNKRTSASNCEQCRLKDSCSEDRPCKDT